MTDLAAPSYPVRQRAYVAEPMSDRQYWSFQIIGWGGLAALSYLSLTIWYNPGQFAPALHTLIQSLAGLIISHPLRRLASRTWSWPMARRIAANFSGGLVASLVWTVWRISTYNLITDETIPFQDYGGWIFASIVVFAAWSMAYHGIRYYRVSGIQRAVAAEALAAASLAETKAKDEKLRRVEAENLSRDTRLSMLQQQLSPHFLLNALNSVSAQVQDGDRDGATEMLSRIGDFLRMALETGDTPFHTLEEELDAVQTYLAIESVRFADRLDISFIVDEDCHNLNIPTLLLQPLFENVIKHAVGKTYEKVSVEMVVKHEADKVLITISNTYPLPHPATDPVKPGIGLKNVEARLNSLYDGAADLSTSQENNSFIVAIALPASVVM
jgi:sensor histidine kinase YesM